MKDLLTFPFEAHFTGARNQVDNMRSNRYSIKFVDIAINTFNQNYSILQCHNALLQGRKCRLQGTY
jgi:hypothetical protein